MGVAVQQAPGDLECDVDGLLVLGEHIRRFY